MRTFADHNGIFVCLGYGIDNHAMLSEPLYCPPPPKTKAQKKKEAKKRKKERKEAAREPNDDLVDMWEEIEKKRLARHKERTRNCGGITEEDWISDFKEKLKGELRCTLCLLYQGQPIVEVFQKTIVLYLKYKDRLAILLRPQPEEVISCLDVPASDGNRAEVLTLLSGCLTLMFSLFAGHLLYSVNTSEAHTDEKLFDNNILLKAGFLAAVRTFDDNWAKLKDDPRVRQCRMEDKHRLGLHEIGGGGPDQCQNCPITAKPDAWVPIVHARALLSLALARACLVTRCGMTISELAGIEKNDNAMGWAKVAQRLLTAAREYAFWTYINREACQTKAKSAIEKWQEWFFPIFEVIKQGCALWECEDGLEQVLRDPIFARTWGLNVRLEPYQVDLSVGYVEQEDVLQ